jgi:hypothetical protein
MKRRGSSNTFFSSNGIALLFIVFSFLSFGQIDSVSVTVQFETGTDPYDANNTVDVLSIDVSIYDINSTGEVLITVYDVDDGNPVARIKKSLTELTTASQISGAVATLKIFDIEPTLDYRIETLVKNDLGANFPLITTNYDAQ